MKTFLYSYPRDGKWFGDDITMETEDEAMAFISKIPFAEYDGVLIKTYELTEEETARILNNVDLL